jgi:molybdopterin synthase catalytic subunit
MVDETMEESPTDVQFLAEQDVYVSLTALHLNISEVLEKVKRDGAGAAVVFTGTSTSE